MYKYLAALLLAAGLGLVTLDAPHCQFISPASPGYPLKPNGGGGANNTAIDGTPVHKNVSASTSSTTLPGLTTSSSGDRICVVCLVNGTGNIVSSVTSTNVTYANRASSDNTGTTCNGSGNQDCLTFFDGVAAGALTSEVITVNFNNPVSFATCDAFAIKGQNGFDANVSLPAIAGAANVVISTSNANDMLLGFYDFGATASPTAGAGWTLISGADFQLVEYKIVTTTQSSLSIPIGTGAGGERSGIGDAVKSN